MLWKRFVVCLLLLMGANALADQNSRQAKLKELMELQGLMATMEEQRAYSEKNAREVGPRLIDQLKEQIPALDAALLAEMEAALAAFIAAASASDMTPAESTDLWMKYYGEQLTEADLDQIVAYYRSPAGQKDLVAQGNALPRWTAAVMERSNQSLEAAISAYTERLKSIVQRAGARKGGKQSSQ